MRINLANPKRGMRRKLVDHLISLYAQEFDCVKQAVYNHLNTGDPQVGEYFVTWLRSQGWQVRYYTMPVPDHKYLDEPTSNWLSLSFGLLFEDTCDKLIAWRLSHT